MKKQDSNIPFREVQKLVPEADKPLFDKVDKIDEFLPLLEKVLIRYSAENILKFQFASDSQTQSALEARYKRLDEALKVIKAKYPSSAIISP